MTQFLYYCSKIGVFSLLAFEKLPELSHKINIFLMRGGVSWPI